MRHYRGLCVFNSLLPGTIDAFNRKRPEIEALYRRYDLPYPKARRNALDYIDGFFEIVNDSKKLEKKIIAGLPMSLAIRLLRKGAGRVPLFVLPLCSAQRMPAQQGWLSKQSVNAGCGTNPSLLAQNLVSNRHVAHSITLVTSVDRVSAV